MISSDPPGEMGGFHFSSELLAEIEEPLLGG
jgi:hypothetical protein